MFLCKLVSPKILSERENELVAAALEGRMLNPVYAVYTDGLFDDEQIAVLVTEKGSEAVRAILGDGWQPCEDAEDYEWAIWFGPLPTIKGPLLRLFAPWQIEKHYSRRGAASSTPLPLFEAA